jgi:acetoin utilization protein AcuB
MHLDGRQVGPLWICSQPGHRQGRLRFAAIERAQGGDRPRAYVPNVDHRKYGRTTHESERSNAKGRERLARDIMSSPVRTVGATDSAREAAARMRGSNILHLVVLDGEGHVAGVLSDRDLRAAQPSALLVKEPAMREKALSLMKVRDVMSPHPHTVDAEAPVTDVLRAMRRERIGCVPVMERDGTVIGVVTSGDVVMLTLKLLGQGC